MTLKDWIIPLFTVLVVVVQSLFSLINKWFDLTQKKDDHRQELRKIYFNRKLEVGDVVIGRWVLTIRHMRIVYNFYANFRVDVEAMDDKSTSAFREHLEFDNEELDKIYTSDKNSFYTFFDESILTESQLKIAKQYADDKAKMKELVRARIKIDYMDLNEEDPIVLISEVFKEYRNALKSLSDSHDKYVIVLKQGCAAIRHELNP